MRRKVCYVSGTRADFGLMKSALNAIVARPELELSILVTGMHLSPAYGLTVGEIEAAGFPIQARTPVILDPATGATMSRALGAMVVAFTNELEHSRPDVVLLLGDRGEMLAGAIAALHLNIPVAHVHGGERSGTIDEPVRHAISKLSHVHLTATSQARERLIRMGENPALIHVTGAPGLDELGAFSPPDRDVFATAYGLDPDRQIALMLYHPVVQHAGRAEAETLCILTALANANLQALVLSPNADGGSDGVRAALERVRAERRFAIRGHLSREEFLGAMSTVDVMIGNSSAAIIEASSFGVPVVNVGPRQNLRERNSNVVDVAPEPSQLAEGIFQQLSRGRFPRENIYGDGRAGERIARILAESSLDDGLMMKANEY